MPERYINAFNWTIAVSLSAQHQFLRLEEHCWLSESAIADNSIGLDGERTTETNLPSHVEDNALR